MEKFSYIDFIFYDLEHGDKADLLSDRKEVLELIKIVLEHKKGEERDKLTNGLLSVVKIIDKKLDGNV